MPDINEITNRLNAQQQLQRVGPRDDFSEVDPTVSKPSFQEVLNDAFGQVDEMQKTADEMVIDFSKGNIENMHDVMVAIEKADMGLKLTVEIRNKLLDAYREIMNLRF